MEDVSTWECGRLCISHGKETSTVCALKVWEFFTRSDIIFSDFHKSTQMYDNTIACWEVSCEGMLGLVEGMCSFQWLGGNGVAQPMLKQAFEILNI